MYVAIARHLCHSTKREKGEWSYNRNHLEVREEHKVILRRLYFDGTIGEKHTSVVHLKKGIPPKYQNSIDKAIRELYRHGYLVPKKTSYGEQVSLNKHMIPKIEGILGVEP